MRNLLRLIAAAALAGAASPALAGELTIVIDLGTLDIANPSDDAAIRERIVTQVSKSCRRSSVIFTSSKVIEDCKADGIAKALDELEARRKLIAAN